MKIFYLFFLSIFFNVQLLYAQHQGYIYAEVALKNKKTYTGQIRWSGGEMLWSDVLVATKQNNHYLKYLKDYQLNNLYEANDSENKVLDWQFMNLWKDKYPERKSEVLNRFGDIARIHVTGENEAQIYYKSGNKVRVTTNADNGSQLGKDIIVIEEKGVFKLDWRQISSVNFRSTPNSLPRLKGTPLYGTINTSIGPLTGYIQWRKGKCSDNHYLKGKSETGVITQFRFNEILSIEKNNTGVLVALKSGKKVFLEITDEVIVVMHPTWGRIMVEWKAFRSVTFKDVDPNTGYNSYPKSRKIYGIVKTKDQHFYKGNCVFDMDEEWDFDLLEGRKDGISYQIPFRYVTQVIPLNKFYAKVMLKSGKMLVLGHHNDVTARNWGAMVWQANSQYKYIPWSNILEMNIR